MTTVTVVVHNGFQRVAPPTANANVLQVAVSADDLCIVANDRNEVHCSPRGFAGAPAWRQLKNAVSWISLSGDTLWAIGTDNNQGLVASRLSGAALSTPKAPVTPSPLRRVSSNASHVCVIAGINNDALCSSIGSELALDERQRVRTDLKEVGVARSSLYGISTNGSIWFADERTLPTLHEKSTSIAADDAFVCVAEQATRDVLCIARSIDRWHRLKTTLWQLAIEDGTLYGVAPNGTLWSTTLSLGKAVVGDESGEPTREVPRDSNSAAAGTTNPTMAPAASVSGTKTT
ncbi:hypothetical protein PINS_up004371 [Pythium insidiosum]|nr:hypothetical protein PINS_up004371 [Pythium insidiosum]